jgi:hypothetical protein
MAKRTAKQPEQQPKAPPKEQPKPAMRGLIESGTRGVYVGSTQLRACRATLQTHVCGRLAEGKRRSVDSERAKVVCPEWASVGALMERFFQLLDVAQLRDRSLVERCPTRRKTIMDSLVAEVSRLGRDQEHLDRTERSIRECKDYIERQQAIVQHLEDNGYDATRAQALLEGLQAFLDLYNRHLVCLRAIAKAPLAITEAPL